METKPDETVNDTFPELASWMSSSSENIYDSTPSLLMDFGTLSSSTISFSSNSDAFRLFADGERGSDSLSSQCRPLIPFSPLPPLGTLVPRSETSSKCESQ